MSIYATPFRRFTLRTDGFASVHVGADVGELVTHPMRFKGMQLVINYSTSAGGGFRVDVLDGSGQLIPDFTLTDSRNLAGDTIEQLAQWR